MDNLLLCKCYIMLYFNAPSEIIQGHICSFSYQYFFENPAFYFLEIRNYKDEFTSNNYQWFMIQKSNLKVTALNLRFVDSSTMVEERFFEEGYLKFNSTSATYIEKYNSAQHSLIQIPSAAIPASVHQAVANFIG
ncbi:hypothetical protein [Pedobacter frigiditerrae]|uniref:hypothetical protein n=1 Tax=Pedobacter frigiditerrae TaxID=2530452 RepID=UPI00292F07C0|nr:hypothetical protein [Pedobacter frigiditerrae]